MPVIVISGQCPLGIFLRFLPINIYTRKLHDVKYIHAMYTSVLFATSQHHVSFRILNEMSIFVMRFFIARHQV